MTRASNPARAQRCVFCAPALLWVVLALGCNTAAPSRLPQTSSAPAARDSHKAVSTDDLLLNPKEKNRALALAHWAAGYHAMTYAGNPDEALAEWALAAALDPDFTKLQEDVANAFERKGQWDKAAPVWERVARSQRNSQELWLRAAVTYQNAKQLPAALAAALQARLANPKQPTSYLLLGELYWQLGRYQEALNSLVQGNELIPDSFELALVLANTAANTLPQEKKMLSPTRARLALGRAASLTEKRADRETLVSLASSNYHVKAGEFSQAAEAWLRLKPLTPQVEAQILGQLNRLSPTELKAVASALDGALHPQSPQAPLQNLLGMVYDLADDTDRAAGAYQKSLELDAGQFEIYRSLALIYGRQKKGAESLAVVARAKVKFPTNPNALWLEGIIQTELKNYKEAVTIYTAAENLAGTESLLNNGLFQFQFGAACERAAQRETATDHFRRAIAIGSDPRFSVPPSYLAGSYNYLGYMWADANQHLEEAQEMIQKALSLAPDNAAYRDSLGWAYFRLGKNEAAAKELALAIKQMTDEADAEHRKLTADDAIVFDHQAQIEFQLGRRNEAIRSWQRAMALDPSNPEFARRLQEAQAPPNNSPGRK